MTKLTNNGSAFITTKLKKAQGFDGEYIIKGNVTEQTKQIGNAVPPPLAKALTKAAMSA